MNQILPSGSMTPAFARGIGGFDDSVMEVNKFSLTQSVDIDLCHVVTANVMDQWGSMY